MKRKDILMLTASMMGIASGWAVLNDQVYAMTDEEPLPRFEEAVSEDKNIADDSIVLPEALLNQQPSLNSLPIRNWLILPPLTGKPQI